MEQFLLSGIKINELLERIGQLMDEKFGKDFQTPQSQQQSKYITRAEVSKLLRISLPTLHEWTKSGLLQSYKIGNRVLYKPEEIQEAINKVSIKKYGRNLS